MQITARGWCAVRAVVAAARCHSEGPVRAATVAEAQDMALTNLYNIMTDLRCAGLIYTYRGTGGGFRLARPPEEISVGDVLRAIDGVLSDGVGQRLDTSRPDQTAVDVDRVWQAIHGAITEIIDNTTIADVVAGGAAGPVGRALARRAADSG